ncbi:MAG: aldo/keto reductase [Pseudomonadota bacterium]
MTTLSTRPLGPFQVTTIGLGCMNLSHGYAPFPTEETGIALLNRALDLGINLLDTAAIYGAGANERLVAKAVGHRRSEYVLASKCVLDIHPNGKRVDASPAAIAATLDAALNRLGTDHIDLYYLHRPDFAVPIEDSVGALVRAKEAGKIGAIGLSEMSADWVRRAHAVHPIAAVQSEYSPIVRNPEIAVLETCRELDIAFVAFSPVARGLLAGAVRRDGFAPDDIRAHLPRFNGDLLAHNLSAVDAYDALAGELGITPAQLSLAWVLARAPHVVTIPGTRSIAHLEENVAAARLTLDAATLARIDAIFAPGAIRGGRYSAGMQAQVGTETFADEELAAAQ